MTESTNEQILTDLAECLRDQIAELTIRLDEANDLNKRLVQSLLSLIESTALPKRAYINGK